ncbi:MAG TPA: amidohydrolase [Candidatus Cloacimonadota bacterium]|nr:amidohydrolase [Candidatus Cloacimonadota bacterium]
MDLIQIRRKLHQIPELGFQEFETTAYLKQILAQFPTLIIRDFTFPGFLAEYRTNNKAYKLFRADIDGLPIREENDCPFVSQHPGKMHACGHDLHMTILLGLIEKVMQQRPDQNLLFLFQPAEEGHGGAERVLETGILDEYEISEAFALHVNGLMSVGTIQSKAGIFFSNTQEVEVNFIGRSAHVARAWEGRNALAAGADFYLNLQKNIQEAFPEENTAICHFGKMQAGTVMNAIAAHCVLEGSMRAFNDADWKKLQSLLENTAQTSAQKYELQYRINYGSFYKHVINNAELYQKLKTKAAELHLIFSEAEKTFTGEDFGYFAERYPGLLFWLGASNGQPNGLHSSDFLPDEKAIPIGIELFYKFI